MLSRSFEDFKVGQTVSTRGRTVEQSDVNAFAGLTWDFYPLHTDELYAQSTRFGRRILHGPLVYAMAVGLMPIDFFGDAIVAFLGVKDLRHLAPVYPGDTIQVRATVQEANAKGQGGGVVSIEYVVLNQDQTTVMHANLQFLMRASGSSAMNEPEGV
ncbi:MAG: 3-hydroxybutyryl-CoA dehydratase [Actinomycetota bacterium]|jgi:acyl dehydratase|nr:3-hydroxybutyryl-CoA dehydratase [Actinomycetota bacterium]